ncbi:hypothetical protein KSF_037630 [Reticulibacter mediterranei]|uniref:Uncharacterized protein n=1 Tax=Reticulibacter mediterranei TaxID=2778369 RepID=A0A8J3N305_9CHLR|nr:hypothetical protein [Reticulibacter mediterranei]GHO93715.1 hypothetical protein KSF_037630 [Reticulibacter mediterranei]
MQEQDHLNEEKQFIGEMKKNREIYSFQDVVYPPPLWKRVAFILLHLVVGFVFGVLVMLLAFKAAPEQSNIVYTILLTASIPGIIHPKTRIRSFGLLLALIIVMPLVLFSYR